MTENSPEIVPVDAEAWEIAFKPYCAYPKAAYDLARHLMAVKQFLECQPPDVLGAVAALDEAAEVLYPFSEFHKAGLELYRIAIEGHATRAHEALMDSLGITYWWANACAQNLSILGATLLAIRQRLGVSQSGMGQLLELTNSAARMSEYESGIREPNLLVLLRYARLAGVSTDLLDRW
jgi:hypothetical protein